jgi:hypothetical protein
MRHEGNQYYQVFISRGAAHNEEGPLAHYTERAGVWPKGLLPFSQPKIDERFTLGKKQKTAVLEWQCAVPQYRTLFIHLFINEMHSHTDLGRAAIFGRPQV